MRPMWTFVSPDDFLLPCNFEYLDALLRMVTGNVALDELVENAVAMADAIAEKCWRGFIPVKK